MADAADYLLNSSFHFDALLADLYFEKGEDPSRDLYDGLDLIEFSVATRPEMDVYAVSAHADSYNFKRKVIERKIPVKHLFDKRDFAIAGDGSEPTADEPWNVVRLDVYKRRLARDPNLIAELDAHFGTGPEVSSLLGRVLANVSPPIVTYIETLPAPLVAKVPIEVICTPTSDGTVCASAPHLGLLVDGYGDLASEAVEQLREVIAAHATELLGEGEFTGYAAALKSHLRHHIEFSHDAD
ncbi:hypothetical protein DBR17_04510 [Sphingomonas sp. HMWF008]|nr:hypothetical protein DBR17_04510 [Sphingomonas sp. HMWF008]